MASLAGAWLGVVAGAGGMRDHDGRVAFAPRLVAPLKRVAFRLLVRGVRLQVEVAPDHASYQAVDGGELEIEHYGEALALGAGGAVERAIPPAPRRETPTQPAGREPRS
jgi:alpha,alpha-trehalose phosphorylase